ncbi:MAG: hypothetical protein ACFFGP_06705 [Promethearchaeota archaeon]
MKKRIKQEIKITVHHEKSCNPYNKILRSFLIEKCCFKKRLKKQFILVIMSDQIKLLLYIKNMLSDLIYINSVIATELIKVTENVVAQRYGQDFLEKSNCIEEHNKINEDIINILEKYYKSTDESEKMKNLTNHVIKHTYRKG